MTKNLAKEQNSSKRLMANFKEYRVFRSPRTSRTDFLHQQLVLPSPLPTPHVIDMPPEFLEANVGYIASWSEVEGRSSSCPRRKEDSKAKKSWSSFCTIVVPRRRHDPPLINVPDLSGALSLFSVSLPLLLSSAPLPPPLASSVLPPVAFSCFPLCPLLLLFLPEPCLCLFSLFYELLLVSFIIGVRHSARVVRRHCG